MVQKIWMWDPDRESIRRISVQAAQKGREYSQHRSVRCQSSKPTVGQDPPRIAVGVEAPEDHGYRDQSRKEDGSAAGPGKSHTGDREKGAYRKKQEDRDIGSRGERPSREPQPKGCQKHSSRGEQLGRQNEFNHGGPERSASVR